MDGFTHMHMACRVIARAVVATVAVVLVVSSAGCSHLIDPNVPVPLRALIEPNLGREYLLYRPSHYDREYDWPLIIVCHTSFPDSPNRRIRDWTEAAESYGFLVAAPTLNGIKRIRPPKADKQLTLQREDEEAILSTVRHIQAGHNVSEDRIFIHGWSGGAYAALFTGLRHADVFRAISLVHPKFNEGFLGDAARYVSPHQPIELSYSVTDAITGKRASECLRWLREHGANVSPDTSGGRSATGMQRPLQFFESVVRDQAWIHIRPVAGAEQSPLDIQFKLRVSHIPTSHHWDFGDGTTATTAEPLHSYAKPGTYLVSVTVNDDEGREHRRAIRLNVPSGTFEATSAHVKAAP